LSAQNCGLALVDISDVFNKSKRAPLDRHWIETISLKAASDKVLIGTKVKATGNVFDEMGMYWAEIADEHKTQRQIQFLKNHLSADGYLLDVACGTGRHSIPLSERGFGMVGLDISIKLLKIAKQRNPKIQVIRGDMQFLPFKREAFSAAIAMDTSFGYLPSKKEDAQNLAEIRRVLRRNGEFIIDVFNRQNLVTKSPSQKISEYPSFLLHQKQTVSKRGDRRCDVWEVHDKADGQVKVFEHSVRLYDRQQLEQLLAFTGFTVKAVFGDYEEQTFSADMPQLIFIAYVI
jgi:ubiquinone/menaquinone biosynthesis C-methylase UbiE